MSTVELKLRGDNIWQTEQPEFRWDFWKLVPVENPQGPLSPQRGAKLKKTQNDYFYFIFIYILRIIYYKN